MNQGTLAGWANFYVLTGTAAAALTGLQFIVQTLVASVLRPQASDDDPGAGIAAFGTPTVVHLSLSLLISAIACAPWPDLTGLRAALGILGAAALGYSAIVVRRTRRQTIYATTMYDWVWYTGLPAVAYAAILASAFIIGQSVWPNFLVAMATLLLLCAGIHNSWDSVTHLTLASLRAAASAGARDQ